MIFGVVAGTKREFEELIKGLIWELDSGRHKVRFQWNQTASRVEIGGSTLFFIRSVDQIRGLKPFYPIFYGTWGTRNDIYDVSLEIHIRNIEKKPSELEDEAKRSFLYQLQPSLVGSGLDTLSYILKTRTDETTP